MPGQNLRLYTSLKPCYMCSGWIRDIFSGNHVTVVSGQLDPRLANQQLQNALAAHQIPSLGMNSESAFELEQKRQQLDQIAKADNSRNAYKKQQFESAIEHSKLVPGERYHAKALILLAELGASIHALPEPEKIHLTAVLSHVKEFFQTVTTITNFGQILANVAAFLDQTRGTHPLKATDQVYQAAAAVKAGQPKYRPQGPTVRRLGYPCPSPQLRSSSSARIAKLRLHRVQRAPSADGSPLLGRTLPGLRRSERIGHSETI